MYRFQRGVVRLPFVQTSKEGIVQRLFISFLLASEVRVTVVPGYCDLYLLHSWSEFVAICLVQSRLLYRAKGRQLRTVREETETSKRRAEIQRKELGEAVEGLRNEVRGWEAKWGETEGELRRCGEELGRCQEEVGNERAAAGLAKTRRREEEEQRRDVAGESLERYYSSMK